VLPLAGMLLGIQLGVAAVGALWIGSLVLLSLAGGSPPVVETVKPRPALRTQLHWIALAAMPSLLILLPFASGNGQGQPFGLVPVSLYQLTLIVAFARMPLNRATPLSWTVQLLGLALCATIAIWQELPGLDGTRSLTLAVIVALAFIPHRWTLALQCVIGAYVAIAVWSTTAGDPLHAFSLREPLPSFLLFGGLVAIAGWGCHGDLVASRPGSERLPQFLFFAGIPASLLAAFTVKFCGNLPLFPVAVVVLSVAVRFIPSAPGAVRSQPEQEPDASGASPPSEAIFEKERRIRP
jgi:hypothetical protein